MMLILIGLLFLFLILWLYNIKRRALLHYEFQYKLRVLREELNLHALTSLSDPSSWAFTYVDHSMKTALSNLKFFNYYVAWGLHLLYAKDRVLSAFIAKLTAEMNLPENRYLKDIHYRFGNLIVEYVTRKHEFFSLVFLKIHSIKVYRNNRDRHKPQSQIINKIKDLRIYQDTAALKKFL
jgi:hypothetical protein